MRGYQDSSFTGNSGSDTDGDTLSEPDAEPGTWSDGNADPVADGVTDPGSLDAGRPVPPNLVSFKWNSTFVEIEILLAADRLANRRREEFFSALIAGRMLFENVFVLDFALFGEVTR